MRENARIAYRYSSSEKFLVGYLVFKIFWSFFTNFSFWYGGALIHLLGERFTLLTDIGLWMSYFLCVSVKSTITTKQDTRNAIVYVAILITIWLLTLLNSGIAENNLIVYAFNGFVIIGIRDELKLKCFDGFVKVLAIMLIPAAVEYVIYELTGVGIITASNIQRGTYDLYVDQLLFNFVYTNYPIQRFQMLTEEPGLLGTCCAFLIFALRGKPQYRFQYVVFIIAGLLTFSFAFYIMLVVHLATSGIKGGYVLLFVVVGSLFYLYFKDAIDVMISYRIESRDGADEMFGRSSYELDKAIDNAWKNGDLWFGHAVQVGEGQAGYKVWIWMYGLIGLFLLFVYYLKYYLNKIKSLKASFFPCVLFFLVFWASFYQRQYIMYLDYLVVVLSIPALNSSLDYVIADSPNKLSKTSTRPRLFNFIKK